MIASISPFPKKRSNIPVLSVVTESLLEALDNLNVVMSDVRTDSGMQP